MDLGTNRGIRHRKGFLLEAKELRLMPEQEKALESQLEDKIIMVNKTTKTKIENGVNEGVAHILQLSITLL